MWACMNTCGWEDAASDCREVCYLQQNASSRVLWMDDNTCTLGAGCFDDPADAYPGYTGAEEIVQRWRTRNACPDAPMEGDPIDLDREMRGVDTVPFTASGCDRGTAVSFWRMNRGSHSPAFTPDFAPAVLDWLTRHPRDFE